MPKVTRIDNDAFEVTVTEAIETTHRVTLNDQYQKVLTSGNISKKKLVEEAFKFLLSRESNTEIFKEFALEIIEQYFPYFPIEMKNRFH